MIARLWCTQVTIMVSRDCYLVVYTSDNHDEL